MVVVVALVKDVRVLLCFSLQVLSRGTYAHLDSLCFFPSECCQSLHTRYLSTKKMVSEGWVQGSFIWLTSYFLLFQKRTCFTYGDFVSNKNEGKIIDSSSNHPPLFFPTPFSRSPAPSLLGNFRCFFLLSSLISALPFPAPQIPSPNHW